MEKQIDIFGNEIDINDLEKTTKPKTKSFNAIFRDKHGYDKKHHCRECKYLIQHIANTIMYCKCEMKGIGSSNHNGTEYACDLFEEDKKQCSICEQPIGKYEYYHRWDSGQVEEPICESCWNDESI